MGADLSRLSLAVQQIPALIWTTDRELRVTSSSGALLAEWKIGPDQHVGVGLAEAIGAGSDYPAVVAARRALAGESGSCIAGWRGHTFQTFVEPLRDVRGHIIGSLGVALDITEQKRADDALRISQARLAAIVDISEDAIISADRERQIMLFNGGAERMFGYTAAEALGKRIDMLVPDRMRAAGVAGGVFSGDAASAPAIRTDIIAVRKDGREFPAEVAISKFEIDGEVVLNLRLRDVTERERARDELQARARQQAAVAEIGQRALWGADMSALMQDACRLVADTLRVEFCKVLELLPGGTALMLRAGVGWKPGLVGHRTVGAGAGSHGGYTLSSSEPVVFEDLAKETRFDEPLLREHGVSSGLAVIIHALGTPFGVLGAHSRQRRVFSVDDIHFLQSVANVLAAAIERTRAEEALRRTNETLRVVNQAAPLALWVLDVEGKVKLWNPAAERTFGWAEREVLDQPLPAIPDSEQQSFQTMLERYRQGDRLNGFETRRMRRDGTLVDVSVWSAPLRGESGSIEGTLVAAVDVTERKRIEAQMRQSQKLESIGLLAGGVAHDFNNLLTGIMGNVSLALEMIPESDGVRRLLDNSLRASERAAELIRQLLAYAGKGRFVIERINLSSLVRDLIALLQTSVPKKVQLRLELDPEGAVVEGDPAQMQQLVMNLVINGAEAIGDEAGTVIVRTGVTDIDEQYVREHLLAGTAPGRYICLEVRDTGAGMDASTKAQIFDPFFTTKFTGRGLGLAAVSGIVRGHRGAIVVESEPGRGSAFRVFLPAADGAERRRTDRPEAHHLTGRGTILVADDEQLVRQTARMTLERYGYNVVLAEDGQQAVEVFREIGARAALVLLDMSMPVMSGEETLRHIRAIRPDVRVIVSSGYNETEAIRRFAGMGLAAFLQKPYTAAQLAEKVKSVLSEAPRAA